MPHLTRRQALSAAIATAGAAASPLAFAEAPLLGVSRPTVFRTRLGAFEITTVLDGVRAFDGPINGIFGQDQSVADVEAALADAFLPTDGIEAGFTPVVVNTGAELILFDAGLGAGGGGRSGLVAGLEAAGYAPEQIDVVVLTHFHPDHIGGLQTDGAPTFPNARYAAPATEFDFWAGQTAEEGLPALVRANVAPLAERMTMLGDGDDVASGVTAVAAFGHTPGHTVFHLESDGRRLMVMADTANHPVLSLARPDWEVRFDADKAAAAATRRRLFGMIAADRIPFAGYHMPFPAIGYVEAAGDGFAYTPAAYPAAL